MSFSEFFIWFECVFFGTISFPQTSKSDSFHVTAFKLNLHSHSIYLSCWMLHQTKIIVFEYKMKTHEILNFDHIRLLDNHINRILKWIADQLSWYIRKLEFSKCKKEKAKRFEVIQIWLGKITHSKRKYSHVMCTHNKLKCANHVHSPFFPARIGLWSLFLFHSFASFFYFGSFKRKTVQFCRDNTYQFKKENSQFNKNKRTKPFTMMFTYSLSCGQVNFSWYLFNDREQIKIK